MFRLSSKVLHRIGLGLGASAYYASQSVSKSVQCNSESKGEDGGSLSVYLSPASKTLLSSHLLDKLGLDKVDLNDSRVVVKGKIDSVDSYIYSPLYGERTAFRLKGMIKTKEGDIVGIGKVSNLSGEVFDEEYESSIILSTKKDTAKMTLDEKRALLDLPTRFYSGNIVENKPFWKGTVREGTVLDKQYSSQDLTVINIPPSKQVVVEGHMCTNQYVDENGRCTFDRSEIPNEIPPEALKSRPKLVNSEHPNFSDLQRRKKEQDGSGSENKDKDKEESEEDEKETCPVCRFMKGGPCRDQFIEWDSCVQGVEKGGDMQKCFKHTLGMMECMRQFEYYDIMSANSEQKMDQVQEQEQEKEKEQEK